MFRTMRGSTLCWKWKFYIPWVNILQCRGRISIKSAFFHFLHLFFRFNITVLWWYRVVNTVIEKKGNLGTFLEIFQTEKQTRKGLWNVWQFSTVGLYLQLMFWYIQHMSFFCRFLHPDLPQCCYLPNELINSFNDLIYNLII